MAHVVELKHPADVVGSKEIDQLRDYVYYLVPVAKPHFKDAMTD